MGMFWAFVKGIKDAKKNNKTTEKAIPLLCMANIFKKTKIITNKTFVTSIDLQHLVCQYFYCVK